MIQTPGRVFRRSMLPDPPVAVEAHGSTIRDAEGREYLDAAGGAIVVGIGHGRREVAEVMAAQAGRLAYAHGSVFTTEPLEAYAREIGRHLPVDGPAIYPVSGGSEAIETALKLARAYYLARGETERWIVFSRWGSYHGNTLGALDLSGRKPLRRPYEGWLGRFRHVSAAYPYRAGLPGSDALATTAELAAELDRAFEAAGPGTVAAFVAEPIVGRDARGGRAARRLLAGDRRGLPAARRPADRRRGDDRVRTDRALVRARPLGRPAGPARGGQGRDLRLLAVRVRGGRGRDPRRRSGPPAGSSTASPTRTTPVGAAVAGEVLRILESESLVEASAAKGDRLRVLLEGRLGEDPHVGEIRGRGLMVGLELVADRRQPGAVPAGRPRHRDGRARRPRARRARLLGHRQRQRRRRRHDPARARRS